jgi:acyl-CoA thioester hydrolase
MSEVPAVEPAGPQPVIVRQTTIRVRYAETDQMGVVYYANYFVWFEVARTDWLRETGWSYRDMEADGVSLPVIEAHCGYRQPVKYDDQVQIRTRATLLTPVRIRFDYELLRPGDDVPAATGYTVHAALDPAGRPCRLPQRVRQLLTGPDPAPGRGPSS